jgi:hypothetical protein
MAGGDNRRLSNGEQVDRITALATANKLSMDFSGRQEVWNLQVMQMRPNQSAAKLRLLADLERAEAKLRLKALEYARSQSQRPN